MQSSSYDQITEKAIQVRFTFIDGLKEHSQLCALSKDSHLWNGKMYAEHLKQR